MSLFRSAVLSVVLLVAALGASHADWGSSEREKSYTNTTSSENAKALLSRLLFTRVGGLAGFDDRLVIETDGVVYRKSAVAQSFKTSLTAEETAALASLLDESGLFTTDQMFTSVGADLITYTIRYMGYTVRADEDQIPPQLRNTLDRLLQLLDEEP